MFPALRFADAGATPAELAKLQAEFDALSPAAQQSRADQWAGIGAPDLIELLAAWRQAQPTEIPAETTAETTAEQPETPTETLLGVVRPPEPDLAEDLAPAAADDDEAGSDFSTSNEAPKPEGGAE